MEVNNNNNNNNIKTYLCRITISVIKTAIKMGPGNEDILNFTNSELSSEFRARA